MNFLKAPHPREVQLKARSEGKIKSHESCVDLRAWSHDQRKRDLYLKEWIKSDMPSSFIPASTIVHFLNTMTCRSKGRVTPRCHPDCRSKVILDSITTSCNAIRECLKKDQSLEKFFCEEELETSHWPYERCLDALKTIKFFWRIVLEKVFAINLRKDECLDQKCSNDCDNVRDIARIWQQDMVNQALFVKRMSARGKRKTCLKKNLSHESSRSSSCDDSPSICKKTVTVIGAADTATKQKNPGPCWYKKKSRRCKNCGKPAKKVFTVEASCGDSDTYDVVTGELPPEGAHKYCGRQEEKIIKLQEENMSLRCQLQKLCQGSMFNSAMYYTTSIAPRQDKNINLPKPFELYIDDTGSTKSSMKSADSELIITMKNCKHESYRHVSLLQVLHKTNGPNIQENYDGPCSKYDEDPIRLLTKVQDTLEAMVRREIILAKDRRRAGSETEIDASFQRINACRASRSELSFLKCI